MPRDLPVAASINIFRGDDGEPVAIVSTGVKLGALGAKHVSGAYQVRVTELAQIKAVDTEVPPVYYGQNATVTIANPVFLEAGAWRLSRHLVAAWWFRARQPYTYRQIHALAKMNSLTAPRPHCTTI
jgi:hypothetical protein